MPELTAAEKQIHEIVNPVSQRVATLNQSLKDIIQSHEALSDQVGRDIGHVTHRMDNIEKPPTPDRAELYAALSEAQGQIQAADQTQESEIRNREGKFLYSFKYADLAACLEVCRKPLSDNGLVIIQLPTLGETEKYAVVRTSTPYMPCN